MQAESDPIISSSLFDKEKNDGMLSNSKRISILVPAYNEEEVLELFYDRVTAIMAQLPYSYEILFVNDGSKDNTLSVMRKLNAQDHRVGFIDLSRNFGKEVAMAAGIDHVSGDALILMDADLQDPPELIPVFIKHWENGYDDVYGCRNSREGETWLKKKTSVWFYSLLARFTRVDVMKNSGDFRLLSEKAINSLRQYREHERYTKGFFALIGHRKMPVYFDRPPRAAGTTKWNYFKLVDLAINGFTSFSTAPLRLATIFGFITSLVAFSYIVFIITKTLLYGDSVAGYPSLVSIVMFLGGVQLICLGIIGEYLAKVFSETKKRPLYLLNEKSLPKHEIK
jgi:polyisoprenyl-phosphate glycosyltransferase